MQSLLSLNVAKVFNPPAACCVLCRKAKKSFSFSILNHTWFPCSHAILILPKIVLHASSFNFFFSSVQFRWIAQLCPTLCDPMDCNMPGLPVHHQLLELTQTYLHWVSDAIQTSHPMSSPSSPAFNLSQHQGLFQWVSSWHLVATVLEFQLQPQSFQWIFRTDFL